MAAHHRCDLGHVRPAAARSVEIVGDLVEEHRTQDSRRHYGEGLGVAVVVVVEAMDGAARRRDLVEECGGVWREDAARAMIGMSSVEWSRYMHDELRVDLELTELTTSTPTRRCCG